MEQIVGYAHTPEIRYLPWCLIKTDVRFECFLKCLRSGCIFLFQMIQDLEFMDQFLMAFSKVTFEREMARHTAWTGQRSTSTTTLGHRSTIPLCTATTRSITIRSELKGNAANWFLPFAHNWVLGLLKVISEWERCWSSWLRVEWPC